ncbi:glycosyltransferase [Pseudomonas sp. I2]|uniref:glycosyltransferase n=1 Tax=unclassified Pseudomonas TaxID=196821 RepID=UPI0034D6250C
MSQVISILYQLAEQGGGVTRVSLGRTAALSKSGLLARVALLDYDEKLDKTFKQLVMQGRVCKTLQVLNFYKWFSYRASCLASDKDASANLDTLVHLRVKVKRRVDHINSTGLCVVRYMTEAGLIFLEEFVKPGNVVVMVMISMPGTGPLKFNSLASAHAYWLKCLSEECLPSFLVADSIGAADSICMIEREGVFRILMMHSNHLLKPYVVGGKVAPKYDGVIRGIPSCDRLVVLTSGQMRDLQEQFPSDKYSVIGNLVTISPDVTDVKREENLAVIVSRLHGIKRIKAIISVFARVVELNSAARLEIWGTGEQEEAIREHIEKLGLQEVVKLMGFATDVSVVFRRASVSLGMSATEGFGISFAESLGYGTPLVSTKTNYGPSEIVTNGVDGYIVDSEDEFVEKVCLLLGNRELVERMGRAGRLSAERYGAKTIVNLWLELFEFLLSSPSGRVDALLPDGPVLQNAMSSRFGWIYLSKFDGDSVRESFLRSVSRARVIDVCRDVEVFGEFISLSTGDYEIDEMIFDGERQRYKFRLMRDGKPYCGVIAGQAVKFILM